MEFLNAVLLQVDEGCRHVADGRLAQLRLALLLLDNAAEIQMQRCATDHIWRELSQEKMRHLALQIPVDRQSEYWKELVEWQPLTYNDKLNISRNFEDKVKYLSGRASVLDSRLVGPLIYLHRYRNEAYHGARIRKETIDTAARLLVEINCILLENLSRSFISYGSGDDYSWLKERFSQDHVDIFPNPKNLVSMAVNDFRSIVSHNEETVKIVLYDHLVSRIEEAYDAIKFIVDNTRYTDPEEVIRDSYNLHIDVSKQEGRSTKALEKSINRHCLKYLSNLQGRLKTIKTACDRIQSFHHFSILEAEFEPVEQSISEFAAKVDEMIQMEIDMARGK